MERGLCLRISIALAMIVGLSGSMSCARQSGDKPLPSPAAQDPVARGEYLVHTSGCEHCHTPGGMYGLPDPSRKLGGSDLGWKGPWGVRYPSNLTPDPTSGLGQWSDSQIVSAIRIAQHRDRTPIQGPMPWFHFVYFNEADAEAIAAYLKSIPPVPHRVPERVPAGQSVQGAFVEIPPPPAWDAPRGAP